MDAEAVKHLGGICQLLGVVLVLQELLTFARHRGELAKAVAKVRGWWVATRIAAVAVVRRLLRRPGRSVTVQAGVASASAVAGSATVSRGMVGPFTPPPGQSVEQQVAALGALVNRLREEILREPQERERAITAEREARQAELQSVADRLKDTTAALRREVGELRETTTGGTRLRLEGVPLLLAGIIFTTWPGGIARALPNWPPLQVVLLFLGAYILARLTSAWWLPPREGQPALKTPQVGCAVLWHGPPPP